MLTDFSEKIQAIRERLGDEDWIHPFAQIRESSIGGKGLFAVKPIQKNDVVVVWGGAYVDSKVAEAARQKHLLVTQWDDNLFSVEQRGAGTGYFVNHSCDSNMWLEGPYALTARRDIEKGEELTADYVLWEADLNYISAWECLCGSAVCRHRVTGKDWLSPKLQEKYRGHFSPLINSRIANRDLNENKNLRDKT